MFRCLSSCVALAGTISALKLLDNFCVDSAQQFSILVLASLRSAKYYSSLTSHDFVEIIQCDSFAILLRQCERLSRADPHPISTDYAQLVKSPNIYPTGRRPHRRRGARRANLTC